MQFESKMKRTFWTTAALGVIPDVVISMILSAVFVGGILGFFAALIGLQVLYLLIWAKNALWSWAVFWFGGRKKLASWLFDYLRENGYPEPGTYEKSADAYLSAVVDNEKLPIAVRLKASRYTQVRSR